MSEGRPGRPTSASRASLPQVRRSANRPTLSGPKGVRAATFAVLGLLVGVIAASAVASGVHAPTAMLAPSTSSIATWVGGPVASLVAGKNPLPPVVDPGNGEIYVTNFDVSNVTVISASAPSVIATIPTGTQPVSPTIDSINGAIYFPLEASSNLSVYSGKNDEFVTTIPVPAVPLPLTPAFDPRTGDLFVSSAVTTTVAVVSGMSNVVIGTIHLPGDALIPTFVNATDTLYFPIEATDNVSVISGSTLGVVANFSVGDSYLQTPAYDPANGDLYFPELSGAQPGEFGAVGVVSTATNALVASVPVGLLPEAPTIDLANGDLYVANDGSGNVSVISGATNALVATVPTGAAPTVPAYDAGNGDLYVANSASDNVTVIAGTTNTAIGEIPVGPDPESAVYDAAGNAVLVANKGANNVTVLTDGTEPTYSATFTESGLPSGTPWTVSLHGVLQNSTASSMAFRFPDGTYPFSVRADAGCVAAHPSGSVSIQGAEVVESVQFTSGACPGLFGLTPGEDWAVLGVVTAGLIAAAAVAVVRARNRRLAADELDASAASSERMTVVEPTVPATPSPSARFRAELRRRQRRRYSLAAALTAIVVGGLLLSVPGFGPSSGGTGASLAGYVVHLGAPVLGVVTCGGGTVAIAERVPWLNSSVPLTTGHVILTVVDVDGDTLWSSGAPPTVTASQACAGTLPVSNFTGISGVNVGFSWYVTLSSPSGSILAFYTLSSGWVPVSGAWWAPIHNGSTLTFICNPSVSRLGAYEFEGPYRLQVGVFTVGGTAVIGSTQL